VLDFAIFQVSGNLPPGITDLSIDFKDDMELPLYSSLFCPHYGGDIDNHEGPYSSFELLESVSTQYPYEIKRDNFNTEAGSSGAPIFLNDGKTLCLVGIHYSGNGETAFGLFFKEIRKVLSGIRTLIAKKPFLETAKQFENDPIIGNDARDMIQNCMNNILKLKFVKGYCVLFRHDIIIEQSTNLANDKGTTTKHHAQSETTTTQTVPTGSVHRQHQWLLNVFIVVIAIILGVIACSQWFQ